MDHEAAEKYSLYHGLAEPGPSVHILCSHNSRIEWHHCYVPGHECTPAKHQTSLHKKLFAMEGLAGKALVAMAGGVVSIVCALAVIIAAIVLVLVIRTQPAEEEESREIVPILKKPPPALSKPLAALNKPPAAQNKPPAAEARRRKPNNGPAQRGLFRMIDQVNLRKKSRSRTIMTDVSNQSKHKPDDLEDDRIICVSPPFQRPKLNKTVYIKNPYKQPNIHEMAKINGRSMKQQIDWMRNIKTQPKHIPDIKALSQQPQPTLEANVKALSQQPQCISNTNVKDLSQQLQAASMTNLNALADHPELTSAINGNPEAHLSEADKVTNFRTQTKPSQFARWLSSRRRGNAKS